MRTRRPALVLVCVALSACDDCARDEEPEFPVAPPTLAPPTPERLSQQADTLKPDARAEHEPGAWRQYADALAAVKRVDEAIAAYDRCAFEGEAKMRAAGDDVGEQLVDDALYCSAAAVVGRQIGRDRGGSGDAGPSKTK